ncbi:hypothetical protein [Actinomadura sp. GC306]|uniref:hypothetical protein n=1 Tax=Actinomadura sp. GC306 TaxID=2530367 RepID=UPI001FB831C8|nr:hypothetical protein [Actinomadura sp. GC306]
MRGQEEQRAVLGRAGPDRPMSGPARNAAASSARWAASRTPYPPIRRTLAVTAVPPQARCSTADYLRGLPAADLHVFDTGHFALEDRLRHIAPLTAGFLAGFCL